MILHCNGSSMRATVFSGFSMQSNWLRKPLFKCIHRPVLSPDEHSSHCCGEKAWWASEYRQRCQHQGKSCKIGNTRLAGTLKNQNPQVLKKLLFWLSCPCLHCFWWEKNNWPPYCTFYKSPMPYSENSNVPAWRIFSISCFHVASDLYFAQISCNRCNKDRIRICETIQWHCCLYIWMSQE